MKLGPIALLLVFCGAALGPIALRETLTARTAAAEPAAIAPAPAAPDPAAPDPAARGRTAFLRKEDNGHYWTNARINGSTIRLMVDSGASVVALTPKDARRLHIDLSQLAFDHEVSTANGRIRAAAVTLDEIVIDRVKVSHVEAMVLSDGLETSLLGMSFLNRLTSWQATPRAIVIRQ